MTVMTGITCITGFTCIICITCITCTTYINCITWFTGNPKNINHWLTHWLTTSNQEMLAHLKIGKCHYISIFVHFLLLATTLWSQKCSCFPSGKEKNAFFSCPTLCLHKHINSPINLFVSKLLLSLKIVPFSWIFFISPVRHASPASDSGTGSVNGKNMQIFLTHQIGAQFKLPRLF